MSEAAFDDQLKLERLEYRKRPATIVIYPLRTDKFRLNNTLCHKH